MSRHHHKKLKLRRAAAAHTAEPTQSARSSWRWYVGAALVIFGIGPMFLMPSYSADSCPDIERNAYREIPLEVRASGVRGKLEYCAFSYHTVGMSATRGYDTTPWSDFCGPTREAVEARVAEFKKPAVDAEQQCKRAFGEAVRSAMHQPFHFFGP